MTIEFKRRLSATVPNASADHDILYLDEMGVYHTKDQLGQDKVLGRGIVSIVKVQDVGLTDVYRITFAGGDTQDYEVTNGRGIADLQKVSTQVLTDRYRIDYNDNTNFEYTVTNGRGIDSLVPFTQLGLVDTYRITFNDGDVFDFNVTNARSIVDVIPPDNPSQPGATDTYTIRFNDGPDETFTVYNGTDGEDGLVLSVNGISQPNIVLTAADVGAIAAAEKGAPNGVATLDGAGLIPANQLPSFVDDVLEFPSLAQFPVTGESGKIYVAIDTGFTYRWSGSTYIIISANQNAFAAITGNTGTATADLPSDTIAITGVNGISTSATDTPDGLVITPAYGTPVTIDAANAAGTANTFARSDHVHAHGDQAGGSLHAAATQSANGFMSATDKTKLDGIQAGAQVNTVTSVFGRTGAVVAQQADYDQFFTTPAEAAAAAPVQSVANGTGISVNQTTGAVVVTNADRGSVAVTNHEAAADPHPQYTTTAEAAAAAPVQSVNGQTGAVTVAAGTDNRSVTRSAPTASASTALTTIQSYPVAAGEIVPGSVYEFEATLRVINTTAASNAVVTLSVGPTNVLVLTQAIGTTAAAAPGAAVHIQGHIQFNSNTQAEAEILAIKQAAVAFTALANTAAPVTVAAAGATTIDLKFNTSAATSTFIARIASIKRVK